MELGPDRGPLRLESAGIPVSTSPFGLAKEYLIARPLSKWGAILASVAATAALLLLIPLIYLFVDLLVYQGRAGPNADLAAARERYESHWREITPDEFSGLQASAARSQGRWHGDLFARVAWAAPFTAHRERYLLGLFLASFFLISLRGLFMNLSAHWACVASVDAVGRLRRTIYAHSYRLGVVAIRPDAQSEAGDLLSRRVEQILDGFMAALTAQIRSPILAVASLAVVLVVNLWVGLAGLFLIAATWMIAGQAAAYFRRDARMANRKTESRLAVLRENLSLMQLVKSYLTERFSQARVERQITDLSKATRRRLRGDTISRPTLYTVAALAGVIVVYVAARAVLGGDLSVAGLFVQACALTALVFAVNRTVSARVRIHRAKEASADVEQPARALEANFSDKTTNSRSTGPIQFAIDGKDNTAWGINVGPGRRNQDRKAVFVAEQPAGFTNGTYWRIGLRQTHGGWNSDDHMNNNLGRFRISATKAEGGAKADPLPKKVRDILAISRDKRTSHQVSLAFSYWRTTVPEWKDANEKIEALRNDYPDGATSMSLLAREEPRTTSVLRRGDWLKPTTPVTAGVPAIFNPLPKNADGSRLTFAKWIADRKSPTTARVMVNRVWQAYFGIGIINTSEDFGTQSEAPSHPELLDWLAVDFMEHEWSFKHLHRLITASATYRQSSKVTPALAEKDPYNRLLARGPRFRVEGEIVRDIALAASGLLNPKIGGRSVMPPAPAFLFQPPTSYAPFPWKHDASAEKYRRALYTFRRRSTPYPALQSFDVPNGDSSCVRRQRSNSPLQALVSLNEPIFVECSQALARKTLAEGGKTDQERITYAFRRALARTPQPDELQELTALLNKEKQRMADGWVSAPEVATGVSAAPKDLPPGTTPTQLAAYTLVSRVLLNLDETITKE